MIVIDASIALAWLLADEKDPRAERALDALHDTSALAPGIWLYEVTNALLVAERRRRLHKTAREMLAVLGSLDVAVVEPRGFPVSEYELAVEHRLSVYDSAYLHLAIEHDAPLATLDANLARAAKRRNRLFL
jgi:predicted nucleic acid-binding protein